MTIPSLVIGIAGGTGAGKTTVAREVTAGLDDADPDSAGRSDTTVASGDAVAHVPLDNYYEDLDLPRAERESINYDHPSAFEWELIREQLGRLLEGRAIEMPQYDFTDHARTDDRVRLEPADVVVVEGIFALYDDRVNEMLDLKLYVETDADVRILRRIRRDVIERDRDLEGVIDRYLSTVKPMHERFVRPTKKRADLVIPEGANTVAIELLESAIDDARGRGRERERRRGSAFEADARSSLEFD